MRQSVLDAIGRSTSAPDIAKLLSATTSVDLKRSLVSMLRDSHDPLARSARGRGAINVIDLANLNSCPFIATQDIGEVFQDGSFTVLGRLDSADVRGCSQMVL